MENQGGRSFYRIILNADLDNGTLEIPQEFLEEQGKSLSRYVCLEVSTGEKWKVELKRREDKFWLCKGLRDFFNYYCITYGYFLVLKYKGKSVFHVLIFHPTALEIEYPCNADKEDREHGDDVSVEIIEAHNLEEEVDVSLENSEQTPKEMQKKREVSSTNQSESSELQRAKAFRTPNPYFIAEMSTAYIVGTYMHIPQSYAKTYFRKMKKNGRLYLKGEHGSACFVKYNVDVGPNKHTRLSSGWIEFVQENRLQVGDVCVFELIDSATNKYKVNIFRTAGPPEVLDENPSFTIPITPFLISRKSLVRVPMEHTKRYLKDIELRGNVMTLIGSSGKEWKVPYNLYPSEPDRARLDNEQWKKFAVDNQLQAGDTCAFDMVSGKVREYKVAITRSF